MARVPSLNPKPRGPGAVGRAVRFALLLGSAVLGFVLALSLAVMCSLP